MRGKKGITLIAGIAVLVLLILSYVLLRSGNKDETEVSEENEKTVTIAELKEENMSSLSFGTKDNMISFHQEENTWYYAEDREFPVDQGAMSDLAAKLAEVKAARTIDQPKDMGEYGLEEPAADIIVKDKEGNETTLHLGNDNTVVSGCYLYLNDDKSKVYLIDSDVKTSFLCNLYDLAEMETFPPVSGTAITQVTIDTQGKQFDIAKDSNSKTGWTVTDWDGTKKPASSTAVSDTGTKISSLSYNSYVNYKEDSMDEYGLTEPTAAITVKYQETTTDSSDNTDSTESEEDTQTTVEKELHLYVGAEDGNGNYYVKTQGIQGVYTISAENLDSIIKEELSSYLDTYVNNVSFADLSKLEVIKDQQTYVLTSKSAEKESSSDEKQDEEESEIELKYYVNEREVDSSEFLAFYSSVSGMDSNSRLESKPETEGEPELTIRFYDNVSGTETSVDYYAYDSNFYLTIDNEDNYLLVNKMNVKDMIEKFDKLTAE